jgi:hypothetical protein
MKRIIARCLIVCVLVTTGCATNPKNIPAKYVSPIGYQSWTCEQLTDEHNRLTAVVDATIKQQKKNADTDAGLMAVGLIIFWPALLGLAATNNDKEAVANVKGEYEAVHEQMRMKGCPMPAPAPVLKEAAADAPAPDAKKRDWSKPVQPVSNEGSATLPTSVNQ